MAEALHRIKEALIKRAQGWAESPTTRTAQEALELAISFVDREIKAARDAALKDTTSELLEAASLFRCIDFDLYTEHDEQLLETVKELIAAHHAKAGA